MVAVFPDSVAPLDATMVRAVWDRAPGGMTAMSKSVTAGVAGVEPEVAKFATGVAQLNVGPDNVSFWTVVPRDVKYIVFPSVLKSILVNCPPASMQVLGTSKVFALLPSGLSSTMLGTGVPLPALPTNMCPFLLTTTAWALPGFVPSLPSNGVFGRTL